MFVIPPQAHPELQLSLIQSDFSQWLLTQWLNWRNYKIFYLLALLPRSNTYLILALLKSTINHGTVVMGWHVLYKYPVFLQRNACSSYTIHTCPCTKLCSNWLRAGKDIVWTVIGYWIKLISVQEKIFSCTDIADLEYFLLQKWIKILWRRMTHQNSNIYNAVAERPPENNGFYWLTPNAPLKILGKNRCRRTDNSEILKTNILLIF